MTYPPFDGYPVDSNETPDSDANTDTSYEQSHTDDNADNGTFVSLTDEDAGKKHARRKAPARQRLNAPQVRRVLAVASTIGEQSEPVRELLGAVLGTSTQVEDLVVGTLNATKATTDTVTELLELAANTNPFNGVLIATAMVTERDSARRTWATLTALGKVAGPIPAKEVVAGVKVAEVAAALTADDIDGLTLVHTLLTA